MAVIAGGMYTPAELAGLTGNGQALLVEVVCCVAMCKLLRRRPSTRTEELQKGVCGDAKDLLQALRKGDAVFETALGGHDMTALDEDHALALGPVRGHASLVHVGLLVQVDGVRGRCGARNDHSVIGRFGRDLR